MQKKFYLKLSCLLMGIMFFIPTMVSAEDTYGSCEWNSDFTLVTCDVGYVETGAAAEGFAPEQPTIADIEITAEDWVANFPISNGVPPTGDNQKDSVDPTTVKTYVNIDYSILTGDEDDKYTVRFLVGDKESSFTTTTNVTFKMPCAEGYELTDGICTSVAVAEEPAADVAAPTVAEPKDQKYTGFEKGNLEDPQAKRTVIVCLLIVIIAFIISLIIFIKYGWRDTNLTKAKVVPDPSLYRNEKEIEFKTGLTFAEYDLLLRQIKNAEKYEAIVQTNWYFDTKNYDNIGDLIAIRIRQENARYELCIKIRHETYNNELNIDLEEDVALDIINKKKLDLKMFKLEEYVPNHKLILITKLNNTRYQYKNKLATIALDCSEYGGKKDYELEIEYPRYEPGKLYFEDYLEVFNIEFKESLPKIVRAFEQHKINSRK